MFHLFCTVKNMETLYKLLFTLWIPYCTYRNRNKRIYRFYVAHNTEVDSLIYVHGMLCMWCWQVNDLAFLINQLSQYILGVGRQCFLAHTHIEQQKSRFAQSCLLRLTQTVIAREYCWVSHYLFCLANGNCLIQSPLWNKYTEIKDT